MTTDRSVDHIKEGVDISIRIQQQLTEGMVARRIASVPSIFCAAPEYLARAGRPTMPEDLRNHACLLFRIPIDGRFVRWGFTREGRHFDAEVRHSMVADDIDVLAKLAVGGAGITRLAAFVAKPYLASGQLEQLFKPCGNAGVTAEMDPLDFYLCVSDRFDLTTKTRAFMDYVLEKLPEEWRVK